MSAYSSSANPNLQPDSVVSEIAAYAARSETVSGEAHATARLALIDSIGCAMLALTYPQCAKLLGPIAAGTVVPGGVRVPGTAYVLDPVKAAFDIGACIRWLDFNDTWLAAEWGHPSDNLGAILAAADYAAQIGIAAYTVRDILTAMVQAYEIQGVLALDNSFNRAGLDHVLLVRVASAAVAARLLGGTEAQIAAAVSQAWLDGGALRTYRHSPNTGSRKSWAAGDAASRAVRLALICLTGEMGYPTPLTAPTWGFQDAVFRGKTITLQRPLGSYVMENILFKIAFPAEFHAQTAVEAAFALHAQVAGRLDEIETIQIVTHESAMRIIDKRGELHNPADRDHCLQYMVAIGLLRGALTAEDYENEAAADPRIDRLRDKMTVSENPQFSADYLNPSKRSIASSVTVVFSDGGQAGPVTVEYPLGHRRRRAEAAPLLMEKFERNLRARMPAAQSDEISALLGDERILLGTPIARLMELLVLPHDEKS